MRSGLWWVAVVIAVTLGGCGIPKAKYYTQVARANRLELHLKKKLDRVDYLEAREKAAQKLTRQARAGDVAHMTRLVGELNRIRDAMHKKEKALSACRASRARSSAPVPALHTTKVPLKKGAGTLKVTLSLGNGLVVRASALNADTRVSTAQLRTALGLALPAITRCTAKALRNRKRSLYGRITATLRVDRRGRIRGVQVPHKPRGANRVARCVRKGLEKLRLSAGAGPLFAVVPFGLSAGRVLIKRGLTTSGLSKRAINRVLLRHRGAIQYCFISSGLEAKKLRTARVKVAFLIKRNGMVGPVNVVSSAPGHTATNACIKRMIRRIKFPRPTGTPPFVQPVFRWRRPVKKRRRRRSRRRR